MPKGWFGPKAMGYGVTPASWQGWLATMLLVALAVGTRFVRPEQFGWPHWARPAALGGALLAYLLLIWVSYDADA